MKRTSKVLSLVAIMCALPAWPVHAQSSNGIRFTTSFPFYVADQKMPAGTYTAKLPNINSQVLLIQNTDWSHSAFVSFGPTESTEPVAQAEVTFHQYGNADYLSTFQLAGKKIGMQLPESGAEKRAAQGAERVATTKSVPLQSANSGY